jgi:uncharacterized protein
MKEEIAPGRGMAAASVAGEALLLHPFKAIFWPAGQSLFIADLHLGKAGHFRRNGLPVPAAVNSGNQERLLSLLFDFQPRQVYFLGDLFHSAYNPAWEEFGDLLAGYPGIGFHLVLGNHDILPERAYQEAGLALQRQPLPLGPFLLSHHPLETVPAGQYNLAGHLHPGVFLRGAGRQRLRLPCFYFGPQQGILPAFGALTGMAAVAPKAGEQVFVIADEAVVAV